MLAAESDKVADLRSVAALYVCAKELSTLRKADGIKAITELVDRGELLACLLYLIVDMAEEALPAVF